MCDKLGEERYGIHGGTCPSSYSRDPWCCRAFGSTDRRVLPTGGISRFLPTRAAGRHLCRTLTPGVPARRLLRVLLRVATRCGPLRARRGEPPIPQTGCPRRTINCSPGACLTLRHHHSYGSLAATSSSSASTTTRSHG